MTDTLVDTLLGITVVLVVVVALLAWKGPAPVRGWLRTHLKWVALGLSALLALLGGTKGLAAWRRKRDEQKAREAERELAKLEGADDELERIEAGQRETIAETEARAVELKREVLRTRDQVEGLTDDEVVAEFRRRYGSNR